MNLKQYIKDIPDFPKPGIIFKDITPLWKNPKAFAHALEELLLICPESKEIDKVIGIESRGFIMGSLLASRLDAGFIPLRKKGKLPADVFSKSYDLEYGSATLEIHQDAITPGDRILLHDDLLATGGTAKAACDLIEDMGGILVQCNFLVELSFLKGQEKLERPIVSLLKY